jgi:hypothetical protein
MKVKKIVLCLLAMALLFTSTACAPAHAPKDLLAYQASPFRASLRGEIRGFCFAGELSHALDDGDTYLLVFTEPPALRGIEVHRRGEEITLAKNAISLADIQWEHLLWAEIPPLFALQGEPLSIIADRERRLTTVTLQTASNHAYTVTLDSERSLPCEIEGDGIRVEIVAFET